MSELLPLFPLSTVLFPGMRLPLHIFEERYRLLAADLQAQPEPRRFGVIAIRKGREVGADGVTALHEVGCVAEVRQIAPHPDGRFDLATVGTERFRLLRVDDSLPYFQGEVELLPEEELPGDAAAGDPATEPERPRVRDAPGAGRVPRLPERPGRPGRRRGQRRRAAGRAAAALLRGRRRDDHRPGGAPVAARRPDGARPAAA